jgi:hypothetical protein
MLDASRLERVKPPLVRAWFDTVFSPLLYGLQMEADALGVGNLSWRYAQRRFATLIPVKAHLLSGAVANFEQMTLLLPNIGREAAGHDQTLDALLTLVREYHDALVESPEFRKVLDACVPSDAVSVFGPANKNDYPAILAEYVVNNVRKLPAYYLTADFWNRHAGEFLALRELAAFRAVDDASRHMMENVASLIATLETVRNELSLEYGVPIFESVAS